MYTLMADLKKLRKRYSDSCQSGAHLDSETHIPDSQSQATRLFRYFVQTPARTAPSKETPGDCARSTGQGVRETSRGVLPHITRITQTRFADCRCNINKTRGRRCASLHRDRCGNGAYASAWNRMPEYEDRAFIGRSTLDEKPI